MITKEIQKELDEYVQWAKDAGYCEQCQYPWHDGICSCHSNSKIVQKVCDSWFKYNKKTKAPALTNYIVKMRKEDFLKTNFTQIQKVTKWKCPICYEEYGTKTHAEKCLSGCRERVLTE